MANELKYICTKSWKRNKVNEVIDRWLFLKYPPEIQEGNFKLVVPAAPAKVAPKPTATATAPATSTTLGDARSRVG